ncbi:hypothetical protein ACR77J_15955 [Tissierella praeacuta]|uniref:hypothetical protein n=1 Tax=Tissierella praeacuta TaxID=43131 RepID=UPI003DA567E3
MYNFKRLISKYSKAPAFILKETEGYRDPNNGGVWVPGKVEEVLIEDGAVAPLSNEDLQFDEGGTYNVEDRKLYCYEDISTGTKIKHKEKIYTVLEKKDYSDFDNELYIYFIKRGDSN